MLVQHHAKYHDGHIPELNQYSNSNRGFSQVASKHRAKYNGDRLQELKQFSGCHRGFGKDKHDDSESDLESERRGGRHPPTIASRSNQQSLAHVSQATQRQRKDAQALKGSILSEPPRPSGARSGPPSPWGSGETKKRIIDDLKDELSDIHLLIGDETTTSRTIKYAKIHELYAPEHDMNKFRQNIKRLIESKKNKTGPFKETPKKKKDEIEAWYSSSKKTCRGYTLLHDMYLKNWDMINPMTAEEIWMSQPEFQKYPLNDFKTYNKSMKNLVYKRVTRAATEDALYQEDMQNHPQKHVTCRGTPFWGQHAAKKMLMKDVEDKIDSKMEIRQLWESRKEYKAFPYEFFRRRVYEVRQKALAAPYWQVKRNKNGRELHRLVTDNMREKWAMDVEMEKMTDMLDRVCM
jgi:hypothetical protein